MVALDCVMGAVEGLGLGKDLRVMSNLVIENTEPRLVELPDVEPKGDNAGYTAYKLSPGENDVPSEYWDAIVSNPGVKICLAVGTIKNNGEGKATSILADLSKIPQQAALRHIGRCDKVALLTQWARGTEGRGLLKAIEERKLELIASQDGAFEDS